MCDLSEQSKFIIQVVENALTNNVKTFDAFSGNIRSIGASYEDLGDYLPALQFFEKNDIVKSEVEKTLAELNSNGNCFTKEQSGLVGSFARGYDQSDLVWGLQLAARKTPSLNPAVDQALEAFWSLFWAGQGVMMRLSKIPIIGYKIPINLQPQLKVLSAEDHGMFIELYAHQYLSTGNLLHLDRARRIQEAFTNTTMYKKFKVFPFFTANDYLSGRILRWAPQFKKRLTQFQLLKQNSNIVWGLFKLLEVTKGDKDIAAQIQDTLDAWVNLFYDAKTGIFLTNYDFSNGRKGADLTCFHIIELLVESARRFGRSDHLTYAGKIADSFLCYQSKSTGLVPFLNPLITQELIRLKIKNNVSWLDSTVDFAIAILKLGITEKNTERFQCFDQIVRGILRYHRLDHGFASSVFVDNGKIDNSVYSTKMTALVLKLFIAKYDKSNIFNMESCTHYALLDR